MTVKDEKVKRILEQCRRKIIKITGKEVSVAVFGYKEETALTIEEITDVVCKVMNVSLRQVILKCRKRERVVARYLIIYYTRQHTKLSHYAIAGRLGYSDHTSGVSALRRINGLIAAKDDLVISSMESIDQLLKTTA